MARRDRRGQSERGQAARERSSIGQVAARLMAEESVHGFAEAKGRAADQLGLTERHRWPRNDEIEAELRAYQALFQAHEQPLWLARMRTTALAAMDALADFSPRLVGSVLRGTAPSDAEITLHVFAEPSEQIASFLFDRGIAWELDEWQGRLGGDRAIERPLYRIEREGESIRLIVFPLEGVREAPRSPVDGKPMARAGRARVAELIAAEDPHADTTRHASGPIPDRLRGNA